VPVHHQEEQMISDPLSSSLSRIEEGFDLGWIEEVLGSMWISDTLNIIRASDIEHWCDFP
jgi:hypothetical protein